MDKTSSVSRSKRKAKSLEDYWACSVCTYQNRAEAFKCQMCDIRKGTSTRKPRINPQLAAQQASPQFGPAPPIKVKKEGSKENSLKRRTSDDKGSKKSWHPPRLKNVDRSSAQTREITVNNVTVIITEYKAKKKKTSDTSSVTSEESHTDASSDTRSNDVGNDSVDS